MQEEEVQTEVTGNDNKDRIRDQEECLKDCSCSTDQEGEAQRETTVNDIEDRMINQEERSED